MNRFEKKAKEIVKELWGYNQFKQQEIIATALFQEYKNGRDKRNKQKVIK